MTSSKITKHINTIVGKTTLINHGLNETALFTDENLASAIENHPCHLLDICLKGS